MSAVGNINGVEVFLGVRVGDGFIVLVFVGDGFGVVANTVLLVGNTDTLIFSGITGNTSVLPSMDENSTEIQPKFPFASIQIHALSSLNP